MSQVKPTRSELLKLKKRLLVAQKGQKLLQQKLDVLMLELSKYVTDYLEQSKKVSAFLKETYISIPEVKAFSTQQSFSTFTNLMEDSLEANISFNSIMGISFPQITISMKKTFSSFYSQVLELYPKAEDLFAKIENMVTTLIKLVELQEIIFALARAIRSTKRRVNALKYYTIPSIERSISFVSFRIKEMEREDFYRLKKVKSKLVKSEELR